MQRPNANDYLSINQCPVTDKYFNFFFDYRDFLPRGTGIVTRRPLILQLINGSMGKERNKNYFFAQIFFDSFSIGNWKLETGNWMYLAFI